MLGKLLLKMGWLSDRVEKFDEPVEPVESVAPIESVEPVATVAPTARIDYLHQTWSQRKADFLANSGDSLAGSFKHANMKIVENAARGAQPKKPAYMHVVFNLGADALQNFLVTGDYLNAYQKPTVGGKIRNASPSRILVDEMLGLTDPASVYFCAISGAGTGVRYYGEYCVALKSPDDAKNVKRVLDRNSYDFIEEPFKGLLDPLSAPLKRDLIQNMMCDFRSDDFNSMLSIKVLQHHAERPRLLTPGHIAEGVLSDEDYVEALHEGSVKLSAILEVRSHPDDKLTELDIENRWRHGVHVTPEELLWMSRRQQVNTSLALNNIPHIRVSGQGRKYRWK
jgi:hypothetical protein